MFFLLTSRLFPDILFTMNNIRKPFVLLMAFMLIGAPFAAAQNVLHEDAQKHYSFTLPADWNELSEAELKDVAAKLDVPMDKREMESYSVQGFSPEEGIPFFLLMEFNLKEPKNLLNKDLVKQFAQGMKTEVTKNGSTAVVSTQEPRMDNERHTAFLSVEMKVADVELTIDVVFLQGLKDMIIVCYYYPSAMQAEYKPVVNAISDSFKFSPEFTYNQAKVDEVKRAKIYRAVGIVFGVLLFAGLVVFVVIKIDNRNSKASLRRPVRYPLNRTTAPGHAPSHSPADNPPEEEQSYEESPPEEPV